MSEVQKEKLKDLFKKFMTSPESVYPWDQYDTWMNIRKEFQSYDSSKWQNLIYSKIICSAAGDQARKNEFNEETIEFLKNYASNPNVENFKKIQERLNIVFNQGKNGQPINYAAKINKMAAIFDNVSSFIPSPKIFKECLKYLAKTYGVVIKGDDWVRANKELNEQLAKLLSDLIDNQQENENSKKDRIFILKAFPTWIQFTNNRKGDEEMIEEEFNIDDITRLLIDNHNIILHGAPGTGKTYLAKEIAKKMIFGDSFDTEKDLTTDEQTQFNEQCGFVQFHQSYDYTDFVEGLRPVNQTGNQIGFKRKDGVFKAFCEKALKEDKPKIPFIFIIDEINRGEMSKIFGELFFSIDPGYRGTKGKIKTQYANLQEEPNEFDSALGIKQNVVKENGKDVDKNIDNYGHFFVPENVYIIGTMNDIDRSVESMDFAMRRRFAFKEITAGQSKTMFDKPDSWKNGNGEKIDVSPCLENIKNRMDYLNNAILNKGFNLNSSYQIGGAYFLKFANYCETNGNKVEGEQKKAFDSLWKNHLEGVLREYLRGMDNVEGEDGKLKKLEKAYNLDVKYKVDGMIEENAKNENQSVEGEAGGENGGVQG